MNTESVPISAEKPKKRRFDATEVEFVAKSVARGLTETEAVLILKKEPKSWFLFKQRGGRGAKFAQILERIRGIRIDHCLGEMEKAAAGKDGVRHDWRAADRLMQVTAPSRFGPTSQTQVNIGPGSQVVVSVGGEDQMRKLVAMYAEAARSTRQTELPVGQMPAQLPSCVSNNETDDQSKG